MVEKNDKLVTTKQITRRRVGGYGSATFPVGTDLTVTRVLANGVWVTGRIQGAYHPEMVSVSLSFEELEEFTSVPDPNAPKPPYLGCTS